MGRSFIAAVIDVCSWPILTRILDDTSYASSRTTHNQKTEPANPTRRMIRALHFHLNRMNTRSLNDVGSANSADAGGRPRSKVPCAPPCSDDECRRLISMLI